MKLDSSVPEGRRCAVLTVTGEVDLSTAPALQRELVRLVDGGTPEVVVDLTGVSFLDSTGLGALVAGRNQARRAGGDLSLVCGQLRLLTVLRAGGFGDVFRISTSLGHALDEVR